MNNAKGKIPVWFLDVDGVINVDTRSKWGPLSRAKVHGYTLHWAPELISEIRRVHDEGIAEVTWCTTWCDHVDVLENLWRLPVLPRAFTIGAPTHKTDVFGLKCEAVAAALDAGRRVVWTDDDIGPAGNPLLADDMADYPASARQFFGCARQRTVQAYVVSPTPADGLQRFDVEQIVQWC